MEIWRYTLNRSKNLFKFGAVAACLLQGVVEGRRSGAGQQQNGD